MQAKPPIEKVWKRTLYAAVLGVILGAVTSTTSLAESILAQPRQTYQAPQGGTAGYGSAFNPGPDPSQSSDTPLYRADGNDGAAYGDERARTDTYATSRDSAATYWGGQNRYRPYRTNRNRYELRSRRWTDRYGTHAAPYRPGHYDSGSQWRERDAYKAYEDNRLTDESTLGLSPSLTQPSSEQPLFADPDTGLERYALDPLPDPAPDTSVQSDEPNTRFGNGLEGGLEQYRAIARAGGWGTVSGGSALKPGATDRRVEQLRRRLEISGELPRQYARGSYYDSNLEIAVKIFQQRHGLGIDGVVGPATVEAMNVPVERRIRQIETNIERWNQSAPELSERYVLINIPAFSLEVIEQGRTVIQMGVVTGKPDHPTPVFSDRIEYVEFSPYWNVPQSITRDELIDEFAANPSAAQGFEVIRNGNTLDATQFDWSAYRGVANVPFTVRQVPGPRNALGGVKFMLPNRYNVYLHDTPARWLFASASRAFSHGCVRLERPRDFAHWLLDDKDGWNAAMVDAALDAGETRQVPLDHFVPVHMVYMTAWLDAEGMVQFRDDLYDKDGETATVATNG